MLAKTFVNVNAHPEYEYYLNLWTQSLERSGLTLETLPSQVTPPAAELKPRTQLRDRFWTADIKYPNDPEYWRCRKLEQDSNVKYISPSATSAIVIADRRRLNQPYLHPSKDWESVLADPKIPLWLTEGEKDAASFCVHTEHNCGGLAGIWCWTGKDLPKNLNDSNKPKPLQYTLRTAALDGRQVNLLYDADARDNGNIHEAMHELARSLRKAGAVVRAWCCDTFTEDGEIEEGAGIGDWMGHWLRQSKDPAKEFDRALNNWHEFDTEVDPILDRHKDCHHVIHGGKAKIMKAEVDEYNSTFYVANDLKELDELSTHFVRDPDKPDSPPISSIKRWAKHPLRKTYQGGTTVLPYRPDETESPMLPEGKFNMFRGWPIQPKKGGSWLLTEDYLRNIICAGHEENYNFLILFLAHMFQYPSVLPGIVVILCSVEEGTGKSAFGEILLRKLMGALLSVITDTEMLTGRFNGITGETLCLMGEEIAWVDDRKGQAKLRALVTARLVKVEHKGIMPFDVHNFMRLIKTVNGEYVASMGMDDRRTFLLRVSPAQMQNKAYFAAIEQELDSGGAEALLWYLLNDVKVEQQLPAIPDSDERTEQAMMGMDLLDQYLLALIEGEAMPLPDTEEGKVNNTLKWSPEMDKRDIRAGFKWWLYRDGSPIGKWEAERAWKPHMSPNSKSLSVRITTRTPSSYRSAQNPRLLVMPEPSVARELFVASFRKNK